VGGCVGAKFFFEFEFVVEWFRPIAAGAGFEPVDELVMRTCRAELEEFGFEV
jgi:hypothetical protein